MNTTLSTEAAADKARDTNRKITTPFEALGLDTAVPEAMRALAETTVTQTREAYEHSKTTLEAGLEAVERSFDALGQGAAALNRKVIEISHRNVSSGFDLAKSLAAAKTLAEIVELQAAHWRKQFGLLMAQAEEVHAASTEVTKLGRDVAIIFSGLLGGSLGIGGSVPRAIEIRLNTSSMYARTIASAAAPESSRASMISSAPSPCR